MVDLLDVKISDVRHNLWYYLALCLVEVKETTKY